MLFNHLLSSGEPLFYHLWLFLLSPLLTSGQPKPAISVAVASLNVTVNLAKWKMKQLMFTLIIATTSFPLITLATTSPLESLLSAQINAARCEARCKPEKDEEEGREAMQCREVCSLLLSSSSLSSSPLCSLPLLCGAGCQMACNPPSPQPAFFLSPLSLSSCSISWHLASSLPAVFLLGAKDRGGKWHLVATTSASSLPRLHLAPSYTKLHLLAVTSTGVVAGSELALDDEEEFEEVDCKGEEEPVRLSNAEPQQHITFNFDLKLRNVLSFALPGCLGLALLLLLLLLLFRRMRKDQGAVAVTFESQREESWRRRGHGVEVGDICNSLRTVPLLRPQIDLVNQIQPKFSIAQNALPRSSPADHFYEEVGNPYAMTRIASFVRK